MADDVIPGTLTSDFYTHLQRVMFAKVERKTLHCFEIFTVHVGLCPTQLAVSHCRKLTAKLWESSGPSSDSVSLL